MYFYPKIQLPLKVHNIKFDFDVSFWTLMYPSQQCIENLMSMRPYNSVQMSNLHKIQF